MNRRRFLSSLGIGVATLYLRVAPKLELPPAQFLVADWYQTTRVMSYASPAYLAALDKIMNGVVDHDAYLARFAAGPRA